MTPFTNVLHGQLLCPSNQHRNAENSRSAAIKQLGEPAGSLEDRAAKEAERPLLATPHVTRLSTPMMKRRSRPCCKTAADAVRPSMRTSCRLMWEHWEERKPKVTSHGQDSTKEQAGAPTALRWTDCLSSGRD